MVDIGSVKVAGQNFHTMPLGTYDVNSVIVKTMFPYLTGVEPKKEHVKEAQKPAEI